MDKRFFKLFLIFGLIFLFGFVIGRTVLAVERPTIQIDIGGFNTQSFQDWTEKTCPPGTQGAGDQKCIEIGWIGQYIGALYRYGVGIAGVLAVLMMMIGGFIWLLSGGSPDKVGQGKDFIISALSGLLLALFSFMILYTINPRLVAMDPVTVLLPREAEFSEYE
ncbi:MAG: hypothetical protein R6W06_02335, partial [Prochlorococcaceae cyanobacterium]